MSGDAHTKRVRRRLEDRVAEEKRKRVAKIIADNSPAGMCLCGHEQEHHAGFNCHGPCTVVGLLECPCPQYTWVGWAPEVQAQIDAVDATLARAVEAMLSGEIDVDGEEFVL